MIHLQSKLDKSLAGLKIIDSDSDLLKQVKKIKGIHDKAYVKEMLSDFIKKQKEPDQLDTFIDNFEKQNKTLIKLMKEDLERTL